MKITNIETYTVGAGWKNWLFLRVLTDVDGLYGVGEATINGFAATVETAIHELEVLAIGQDPRNVNAIARKIITTFADVGHIHRLAMAGIEMACWDILGKSLGVPVWQLLGGKQRDSILCYANGWYRAERTPEAFLEKAKEAAAKGFKAVKIDPFGLGWRFIDEKELQYTYQILQALRDHFGPEFKIAIDVHTRLAPAEAVRIAERLAPLNLYWWEEPTPSYREEWVCEVARRCPISVAEGEEFDKVEQFETLARGGGVSIWQPEPMSLGGIWSTLQVAHLAAANNAYIAPHQSGGPIATAVCLQLAAIVPNFLIQEHFLPFNEQWTNELVTWTPTINPENGHLDIPAGPGLGLDLNLDVVRDHPYEHGLFFTGADEGWEKRLGKKAKRT